MPHFIRARRAAAALLFALSHTLAAPLPAQNCGNHLVHQPLLDLLPAGAETHRAVADGDWSASGTWLGGAVPDHGALVLIPAGRTVTVDRIVAARLETVRVDGTLRFQHDVATRLMVDTLFSAPGSRFEMGTPQQPIRADVTAELVILADGPIDEAVDPQQIGRGLVLHGPTRICGSYRQPRLPLQQDLPAGSQLLWLERPTLTLDPIPGWRVGDEVVVAGTSYDPQGSDHDDTRFHDEVLTVRGLLGPLVGFTNNGITQGNPAPANALRFDHVRPDSFVRDMLRIPVANLTRNVIVRSEDPTVPVRERGHVMVMHEPDVIIENALFRDLGRSDKTRNADDPVINADGSPGFGTNPRGRYGLHLHRNLPRSGALDPGCAPSIVRGCVVRGSPGWGLVHHDSHAILEDNVVFDVVGSGIVAEAGNEVGAWRNNLAIKMRGDDADRHQEINPRLARYDFGFNGEGYWLQGSPRVEFVGNVAASCAGPGFALFSHADAIQNRDAETIPIAHLEPELAGIVGPGVTQIDISHLPFVRFHDYEALNCHTGILTWHNNRNDDGVAGFVCPCDRLDHRFRSRFDNFRLWSIYGDGIFTQYTTQADFTNGVILGNPRSPVPVYLRDDGAGRGNGISQNGPAQNLGYGVLWIEGFTNGMRVPTAGREWDPSEPLARSLMTTVLFNRVTHVFSKRAVNFGVDQPFPGFFAPHQIWTAGLPGGNAPPTAAFVARPLGGQAQLLDARSSFDPDPAAALTLAGNGIVAYGWDLDGDGDHDAFGETIVVHPTTAQQVTLTVWDHQAATRTATQTVVPANTTYGELLVDGDFASTTPYLAGWQLSTPTAGAGWAVRDCQRLGTTLHAIGQQWGVAGLAQIVRDRKARRGINRLRWRLFNTEGDARPNSIRVRVWGVHGELQGSAEGDGPSALGTVPMDATLLYDQTEGGVSHGWRAFDQPIDFGAAGFEFVYIDVRIRGVSAAAGDDVRLDDLSVRGL